MAGRIRDADIAEVRERNRIDEVVGEYRQVAALTDAQAVRWHAELCGCAP